jgi:hypothetical protein
MKLKDDKLLSKFAVKNKSRHYTAGDDAGYTYAASFGIQLEVVVTDTRFAAGS